MTVKEVKYKIGADGKQITDRSDKNLCLTAQEIETIIDLLDSVDKLTWDLAEELYDGLEHKDTIFEA